MRDRDHKAMGNDRMWKPEWTAVVQNILSVSPRYLGWSSIQVNMEVSTYVGRVEVTFILQKSNSSNLLFCSDHTFFSFRKHFSCSIAYSRL